MDVDRFNFWFWVIGLGIQSPMWFLAGCEIYKAHTNKEPGGHP
jgi:hypothetical protein